VHNVPNPGSVKLTGTVGNRFIDCSEIYKKRTTVKRFLPGVPTGTHIHLGDVVLAVHPYPYHHTISSVLTRAAQHWKAKRAKRQRETADGKSDVRNADVPILFFFGACAASGVGVNVHLDDGEDSLLLMHDHKQNLSAGNAGRDPRLTNRPVYGTLHELL